MNSYQLRVEAAADDDVVKLHRADHDGDPLTTADLERVLPVGHQITLTTPDGATLVAGPVEATGPTDQEEIPGVGTLRLTDGTEALARSHLQAGLAIVTTRIEAPTVRGTSPTHSEAPQFLHFMR